MIERGLVEVLRDTIGGADPSWVSQPSRLRRGLQEQLGADARRHRAQIHQLVVSAEERVPIRLQRNGWSPQERRELIDLLITTRGWTPQAAEWAVVTWAAALNLTDEQPAAPAPMLPPGGDDTNRVVTGRPSDWLVTPTESPDVVLPGPTEIVSPSTTPHVPTPAPFPAAPQAPAPFPPPGTPVPPSAPSPLPTPPSGELPRTMTKSATKKASAFLGTPVDVAYGVTASNPVFLLMAGVVLLGSLVVGGLVGAAARFLATVVILVIILARSKMVLAVQGERVWLLKAGLGLKPSAVMAETTRAGVVAAGGFPFASVRMADRRLWLAAIMHRGVPERLAAGGLA